MKLKRLSLFYDRGKKMLKPIVIRAEVKKYVCFGDVSILRRKEDNFLKYWSSEKYYFENFDITLQKMNVKYYTYTQVLVRLDEALTMTDTFNVYNNLERLIQIWFRLPF